MQRPRPILALMERCLTLLETLHGNTKSAAHQAGAAGERAAYFYLRRLGYCIVARQWRQPPLDGEVDLVAWEGETLCFVEVKTRSARTPFAAEFAVDAAKQAVLRRMAAAYTALLRRPGNQAAPLEVRFDVVSVYLDNAREPDIRLIRDAFR